MTTIKKTIKKNDNDEPENFISFYYPVQLNTCDLLELNIMKLHEKILILKRTYLHFMMNGIASTTLKEDNPSFYANIMQSTVWQYCRKSTIESMKKDFMHLTGLSEPTTNHITVQSYCEERHRAFMQSNVWKISMSSMFMLDYFAILKKLKDQFNRDVPLPTCYQFISADMTHAQLVEIVDYLYDKKCMETMKDALKDDIDRLNERLSRSFPECNVEMKISLERKKVF